MKKQKKWYDKNAIKTSIDFYEAQGVYVQKKFKKTWIPDKIIKRCNAPRSYLVQLNGRNVRRNSKWIKAIRYFEENIKNELTVINNREKVNIDWKMN